MPTSCRRPLTFFLALVIAVSSATALASPDADADTLVQRAFTWYRKAAEQDEPTALFNVGFMYEEARGVARNIDEAFRYYQKAAERGYQEARRILGNTAR